MIRKKVAVTFPTLNTYGGAESVCLEICDHLSKKYDVELVCYNSKLNKNLKISEKYRINIIKSKNNLINFICSRVILCAQIFIIYYIKAKRKKYDFIFSASGEIISDLPTVQLVHHPFFSLNISHYLALGINKYHIHKLLARFLLTLVLKIFFNIKKNDISKNTTICNSNWSSNRYLEVYKKGTAESIYLTYLLDSPYQQDFTDFERRENNFVILGRVSSDKRIDEGISVFKKLNIKNKMKLYIIGSGDNKYINFLKKKYPCQNIIFKGFIDEDEKLKILRDSKYGLHLFRFEHFGMAPCEMQNQGMLVFVYNDGGVAEIIQSNNQKFNNKNELVRIIEQNINLESQREKNHKIMRNQQKKFLKNHFYNRLDEVISKVYEK